MPSTTRKRKSPSSVNANTQSTVTKRRRSSQSDEPPSKRIPSRRSTRLQNPFSDDDGFFGDDDRSDRKGKHDAAVAGNVIDLATSDEVPEPNQPVAAPNEQPRISVAAFQCAICMDDVKDLTVTHCGHLYCSECLHSAMHVEATRHKCPICRQKIDLRERQGYNTKTKGFWHLELKFMTATKKGKQPSR